MIRPDQIPDEVVEAVAMVLHANNELLYDVSWDDLGDYDKDAYREEARAAIAAALNAWQGMEMRPTFNPSRIILPLTQESPND